MQSKLSTGGKIWHICVIIVVIAYMLTPVFGTIMFSIADEWGGILPKGYTLKWYEELFNDLRFWQAIGRSFLVSILSTVITLIVMVPAVFVAATYLPQYERLMQGIVLLPFALPGIVLAVGLMRIYSSGPIPLTGTIWILVGVYFTVIMPYVYQSVRNSLRSINAIQLVEAAEVLGAGKAQAFLRVVLPNIMPGLLVAGLLSISLLLGEFVLANMLVGGSFEVLQVFLFHKFSISGHLVSAIIVIFFTVIFFFYLIILTISGRRPKAKPVAIAEEGDQA